MQDGQLTAGIAVLSEDSRVVLFEGTVVDGHGRDWRQAVLDGGGKW